MARKALGAVLFGLVLAGCQMGNVPPIQYDTATVSMESLRTLKEMRDKEALSGPGVIAHDYLWTWPFFVLDKKVESLPPARPGSPPRFRATLWFNILLSCIAQGENSIEFDEEGERILTISRSSSVLGGVLHDFELTAARDTSGVTRRISRTRLLLGITEFGTDADGQSYLKIFGYKF